jgi:putative ABC transport system permease protein
MEVLRSVGGRATGLRGGRRLRHGVVVTEVALSFILLIGAGLMIRSFVKLQNVNPGFNPGGVLSMRLSANFSRYTQPQQYKTLGDGILSNVGSVPGVESAGLASNFPFNPTRLATGPANVRFAIEGQPDSATQLAMVVDRNAVSSGYFMTVGQPLLRGRRFTEHDDAQALPVAVINQTMARHRWPEQDPIGKRVSFNQGTSWIEVVGVVGDVKEYGLDRSIRDEVYVPLAQAGGFTGNLVVRTAGDPVAIWPAVRAALRAVDPQLAVDRMSTIESLREESIASPRVTTIMLGLFAGLALLISAGGIGALIALMVSRRTNEIGIRMALGASRASLLFMLLRQGLALALAGTLVGIAGAAALTKLMSTLLYDTSPTDITTFAAISVLFVTVALVACLIPARQITRIDPLIALRQE